MDFRVHGNGREPVVASKKGIPRRKSFTSDKAHLGRNRSTSIGCSQDALIKKRASVVDKQEVAAASHERKLAFLEHQLNEALNEIDHLKPEYHHISLLLSVPQELTIVPSMSRSLVLHFRCIA